MTNQTQASETLRIPVIEEVLHVGKRLTDTGRGVRLHKSVSEEAWRIDETLMKQVLELNHVPINTWVAADALPVQRHEGQTLIIPVLEEVLVIEKRVLLKEEIRITVKTESRQTSKRVVLSKEQVSAERFDDAAEIPTSSFEGNRND